jgi:DNA modification methylase
MSAPRKEVLAEGVELWLGDMIDILPTLGRFDACVTDPPYGIGMDGGNVGYKGFNDLEKKGWDKAPPTDQAIEMIIACADNYVIWGGNYFGLPPARCYLVWDKGAGFKNRSYAESELALTNLDANARTFTHDPLAKGDYKGKQHPTQKPVEVMKWCLGFLPDAKRIVDPYCGSGSTGVAAVKIGKSFTGIEIDEGYFAIACKRIEAALRQPDFFVEPPKPIKQEAFL